MKIEYRPIRTPEKPKAEAKAKKPKPKPKPTLSNRSAEYCNSWRLDY